MHDEKIAPPSSLVSGDEMDLRELFRILWMRRWLVLTSGFSALALSALYAFLIAKPAYESSVLLLPTQASSLNSLGAAAALLGQSSSPGNADVDLYQSLLSSRAVTRKLLEEPLKDLSDTGKGCMVPLFQLLGVDTGNFVDLDGAIQGLSNSVTVDTKQSGAGGILEIKFSASAPWLAQEIGSALLEIGQEELRQIRVQRAEAVLPRLAAAASQAKAEWDSSARFVTWYKDRNRSIILPEQILELSRLQMEQVVHEQKYLQVRKEYEAQVLEREKAVPPMMVLDPPDFPVHKSKPKRVMILALGLIAGLMISSMGVLGWNVLVTPTSKA
jgi:uncharacterized protein involved in exopolysaccharide biosynthesis